MRELEVGDKAVEFQLELILWKLNEIAKTKIKLSSANCNQESSKIPASSDEDSR